MFENPRYLELLLQSSAPTRQRYSKEATRIPTNIAASQNAGQPRERAVTAQANRNIEFGREAYARRALRQDATLVAGARRPLLMPLAKQVRDHGHAGDQEQHQREIYAQGSHVRLVFLPLRPRDGKQECAVLDGHDIVRHRAIKHKHPSRRQIKFFAANMHL
jgi:hypothetical protein